MIYLNKMNYNIYLSFDNFSKNKQSILPLFLNIQLYYYNIYLLIINISVHLPVFIISGNMQSIFHRCLNYQYHNYYVYLLIIITSKDRQLKLPLSFNYQYYNYYVYLLVTGILSKSMMESIFRLCISPMVNTFLVYSGVNITFDLNLSVL